MRNRSSLNLILLAAMPLAAQTGSGKPASVEGVVTNAVTGAPIPRVHVTLQGAIDGQSGQYGTTAGADGTFAIAGIAPGHYSVDGKRAGFVMPSGPRDRSRMELKADDAKTGIEIKLMPTGAITGRVTDSDGQPVEGASVEAQGTRSRDSATTDEQGQFRIGGLEPGRYRVKASSEDDIWAGRPEIRTDGTVEVHNAASYYPGVLGEKEAGTVRVQAAGESTGVDIRLVRVPFVRVSGKVAGIPPSVEKADITVWQDSSGIGVDLKPDRSFETWRLDPGQYRLVAEWNGPDGEQARTTGGDIEVAGSNIDNIELRVIPDSNISGQLEFEDDTVKQTIRKDLPGALVKFFEMGAEAGNLSSPEVSTDGTFRLEKVPPGKYRLGLWSDKAYVKSMRLGSKVIEGAVLDLGNGSGGADLSVLVSASTASISGTVQDDKGNAAGTVVVLTEAGTETGFEPRRATAAADGTYTFANLPPGSFKLVAVEENDPATQGNDVLGYENQMESVDVGAGEKATKDLKRRMPE